jgi:hypothetical protein
MILITRRAGYADMKLIDLTNQRFGRLTVIERDGYAHKQSTWRCVCDCGNEKVTKSQNLRKGLTESCGCLHKERAAEAGQLTVKHGHGYGTGTYKSWQGMWQRCTNENDVGYENYGAKGVMVCERWREFEAFLEDMGERPKGLTLDRINPFGNYEPSNCRWADWFVQNNNKRWHWERAKNVCS